jgi:hypothetical protein
MSESKVVNAILSPTSIFILSCLLLLVFGLSGSYQSQSGPAPALRWVVGGIPVFLMIISIIGLAMPKVVAPDDSESESESESETSKVSHVADNSEPVAHNSNPVSVE